MCTYIHVPACIYIYVYLYTVYQPLVQQPEPTTNHGFFPQVRTARRLGSSCEAMLTPRWDMGWERPLDVGKQAA